MKCSSYKILFLNICRFGSCVCRLLLFDGAKVIANKNMHAERIRLSSFIRTASRKLYMNFSCCIGGGSKIGADVVEVCFDARTDVSGGRAQGVRRLRFEGKKWFKQTLTGTKTFHKNSCLAEKKKMLFSRLFVVDWYIWFAWPNHSKSKYISWCSYVAILVMLEFAKPKLFNNTKISSCRNCALFCD